MGGSPPPWCPCPHATEGALIPRLLGTYECELHPHLAALSAEGLDCVIDVGCAEGYYAVKCVHEINAKLGVDMPITEATYRMLYERIAPTIEMRLLSDLLA